MRGVDEQRRGRRRRCSDRGRRPNVLRGLQLGALVRCQGRVTEYREKEQFKVDALQRCDDANAEPLFWLDHARCVEDIRGASNR